MTRTDSSVLINRELLQAVINGIPDPVLVIGTDHRVIFRNQAASDFSTPEFHRPCYEAIWDRNSPCEQCPLEIVKDSMAPVRVVRDRVHEDGSQSFYQLHAAPFLDENGDFVGVVESFRDITQLMQYRQQTQHLVHHDALTGLPNRSLAFDRLEQALISAHRDKHHLAVALLSLDRFHLVVGSLGHTLGDQALVQVAERLLGCAAIGATVARTGSDEFMLLFPGLSSVDRAAAIPKLIRAALRDPLSLGEQEVFQTASIGISVYPEDGQDGDTLLKNAAAALQRAQRQGGGEYRMCSSVLNAAATRRLRLENDLRRALKREEYEVYYQPLVNLERAKITGFEALLRWNNSRGEIIQPAEFIPVLEETGFIVDVGEWVLRRVCRQLLQWQRMVDEPLRIAVNLSARQFRDPHLAENVLRILTETGAEPSWLDLELTESILMEDVETAARTMALLKEIGIRISIDDFGTGYSSLAYLKRLPADTLKIDRSFVAGSTTNSDDAVITSMLIDMAHRFGLEVVAEGIETDEQFRFLRVHDCDYGQGYLLGRPMPAEPASLMLGKDADRCGPQSG